LIAVTMPLTGALFCTISPTPAIHLIEPGRDLSQRDDHRHEVEDERGDDQHDGQDHHHARC